ncbi:polyprotein [Striga asiatica]|uniref:Polyprotein n=1 Tax=Striga asiatica TaxID=4170 RepID=A0A5A7PZZ6_STRAF|nr:polyprotein [Striga asiatica]
MLSPLSEYGTHFSYWLLAGVKSAYSVLLCPAGLVLVFANQHPGPQLRSDSTCFLEIPTSSGKEICLPGIGHCFLSTPILDKQLSSLLLFTEKKSACAAYHTLYFREIGHMKRESSNQGESAYFSLVDACTRTGPYVNNSTYHLSSGLTNSENHLRMGSFSKPSPNSHRGRAPFMKGRGRTNTYDFTDTDKSTEKPWVIQLIGVATDYNYQPPPAKHLAAYVADMEFASPDSWLLDSGATNHLTADFHNLSMHSVYEGEELIQAIPLSSNRPLQLNNVLHVPAIKKNLLSLSQLTRA